MLFNMMQSVCMVKYFVNKGNVYIVTDKTLFLLIYTESHENLYLQVTHRGVGGGKYINVLKMSEVTQYFPN